MLLGFSSSFVILILRKMLVCVKNTSFECCYGGYHSSSKSRHVPTGELDESKHKKKRLRLQPSKKIGCPAKMRVKCIRIYPDYKMDSDHHSLWKLKKEVTTQLKQDLKSRNPPRCVLRYYVHISGVAHHSHTVAPAVFGERLHPKLKSEIHHLVKNNITTPATIKEYLKDFVENMFKNKSKPQLTNSVFYPSHKIIRNYVYAAQMKRSKLDHDSPKEDQPSPLRLNVGDECANYYYQCVGDGITLKADVGLVDPLLDFPANEDCELATGRDCTEESRGDSDAADTNGIAVLATASGEKCRQRCREKLKEILNLTYLCHEERVIRELLVDLTKHSERLSGKVGEVGSETSEPVNARKRKSCEDRSVPSPTAKTVKQDQEKTSDMWKCADLQGVVKPNIYDLF